MRPIARTLTAWVDHETIGTPPRTSLESWRTSVAAQLASPKEEADAWLCDESYDALGTAWKLLTPLLRRPLWRQGVGCSLTRETTDN